MDRRCSASSASRSSSLAFSSDELGVLDLHRRSRVRILQRTDAVELGLRVVERDLGAVDGDLLGVGIKQGDHAAGFDHAAWHRLDLGERAGGIRGDDDRIVGAAGADRRQPVVDRGIGDDRRDDGRRRGVSIALAALCLGGRSGRFGLVGGRVRPVDPP